MKYVIISTYTLSPQLQLSVASYDFVHAWHTFALIRLLLYSTGSSILFYSLNSSRIEFLVTSMGRKKRKNDDLDPPVAASGAETEAETRDELMGAIQIIKQESTPEEPLAAATSVSDTPAVVADDGDKKEDAPVASNSYGLHAHSADIVDDDVYISDGSEDEADMEAEIVLAGSRMGVMRRGLHHPLLVQPTRQWKREETAPSEMAEDAAAATQEDNDDLAQLDPAQRAARLLQEKQRKLQEAKEAARRMESEENAGRDPCLFSKRTAFDIRMDQVEDKPWTRGDITDFFNYTLTEEDWMDYSTQQLAIRQELTDAIRQRRPPDPNIVPVTARAPAKQTPKVALAGESLEGGEDSGMGDEDSPVIGPYMPQGGIKEEEPILKAEALEEGTDIQHLGSGGAWGAGAAPGSLLARLIEEQENRGQSPVSSIVEPPRQYEEESYHEPEQQHYGRVHDDRSGYDNYGGGYDRYGVQQQAYFASRGGYGVHSDGGDYEDRAYSGPPPHWPGHGGRGGPPPWAGRGGRGRGRGGYGSMDEAHSRKRSHDDHYGGGGWR